MSDQSLLFGSDLEETGDPATGWSAIVDSKTRPSTKAHVFKIPHHGSKTADHPRVWSDMLLENPFAVLTPFNQGNTNLPTVSDVQRVCRYTSNAYATARPLTKQTRRRHGILEKTIRETVRSIRLIEGPTGHVRLRKNVREIDSPWNVEMFNGAIKLERTYREATSGT